MGKDAEAHTCLPLVLANEVTEAFGTAFDLGLQALVALEHQNPPLSP